MSKKTPTTEYAKIALDELLQLVFVCEQLANDLRCAEGELQKRNTKWPDLPPVTNQPFNSAASRFLGVLLLCRAVDIYNWYCRETLKLALSSNPNPVVSILRNTTGEIANAIGRADRNKKDAAAEIIRGFLSDRYRGDRTIRETIHQNLKVLQNPEVELLCICRNVIVHKRGYDEFGEIAEAIQKLGPNRALFGPSRFPPNHMPITLDADRYLIIDDTTGSWAAQLLQQQIFTMDQNFAHVYKLPRKVWERVSIGRKWLGPSKR